MTKTFRTFLILTVISLLALALMAMAEQPNGCEAQSIEALMHGEKCGSWHATSTPTATRPQKPGQPTATPTKYLDCPGWPVAPDGCGNPNP